MDLILCEKPSQGAAYIDALGIKIKKTGYAEGAGYIITWGIGHVYELDEPAAYDPKFKKWVMADLPILPTQMKMKPTASKNAQIAVIKTQLKRCRRVLIATDYDREGEAIARNILSYAGYRGEIQRVKCSSYEASDINDALRNLLPDNEGVLRFKAQQARSWLDWLLGMNFSRLFGLRFNKNKIAYGRVLTPTLRIACLRERAIREYKPAYFYHIKTQINSTSGKFTAKVKLPNEFVNDHGGLSSHEEACAIADHLKGMQGVVDAFSETREKKYAPLPYVLSILSSDAEKIGISPTETKDILQKLYESKLVTYPRTDNRHIPLSMLDKVPAIFSHLATREDLAAIMPLCDQSIRGKCWKDVDPSVSPHHAIVPTEKPAGQLTGKEHSIYHLISKRFLQQFMGPCLIDVRNVEITVECSQDFTLQLTATSRVEVEPGWKAINVDNEEGDEDDVKDLDQGNFLPKLEQGQVVIINDASPEEKQTSKPRRFTFSSLIDEMKIAAKYVKNPEYKSIIRDEAGLGTEATQIDIVSNAIQKEMLLIKSGKIHVPQEVENYIGNLPEELALPDMTALFEIMLKGIEKGEITQEEVMGDVRRLIVNSVERYRV